MDQIDPRLEQQKSYGRAMQSYVMMIYEFVLEIRPRKILETGVQNGQSTKTMLMALGKIGAGELVSIDQKDRSTILDAEYSDLKKYWRFLKSNSHAPEALQFAKDSLAEGELYDMFLIDGDHKMPGCGQDFYEYSTLVKSGGIIMLHDITNQNEDVYQLWDEITWEKFAINWGRARNHVIPGFGIVRKP